MNLAIRGISSNLGEVAADTFFKDQHETLKADFIMATRLTQREKAEQIILEKLTLQSPISSKEMEAWYLAQGISKSTVERVAAGTDMIKREKCGDIWYWSLKE